jgi:hypothetical protein
VVRPRILQPKKIIIGLPRRSTTVHSRFIPARPHAENERRMRSFSTSDRSAARLYKQKPQRVPTKQQFRRVRACPWRNPVFEWFGMKLAEKNRQIIVE